MTVTVERRFRYGHRACVVRPTLPAPVGGVAMPEIEWYPSPPSAQMCRRSEFELHTLLRRATDGLAKEALRLALGNATGARQINPGDVIAGEAKGSR